MHPFCGCSTSIFAATPTPCDSSISVGDLNGDGFPDVVAAFEFTGTVTWYQNVDGVGDFSAGVDIATDAPGATWVTVADLDNDGDLDVVSSSSTNGMVWMHV